MEIVLDVSLKKILLLSGLVPKRSKLSWLFWPWKKNVGWMCVYLPRLQHRHLLDQILVSFGIEPDIDLDAMRLQSDPHQLDRPLLLDLDTVLLQERPDAVWHRAIPRRCWPAPLACFITVYRWVMLRLVPAPGICNNRFQRANRVMTRQVGALALCTDGKRPAKPVERGRLRCRYCGHRQHGD